MEFTRGVVCLVLAAMIVCGGCSMSAAAQFCPRVQRDFGDKHWCMKCEISTKKATFIFVDRDAGEGVFMNTVCGNRAAPKYNWFKSIGSGTIEVFGQYEDDSRGTRCMSHGNWEHSDKDGTLTHYMNYEDGKPAARVVFKVNPNPAGGDCGNHW